MGRIKTLIRLEYLRLTLIIIVTYVMVTSILLEYPTDFFSAMVAYTERSLMIKHDIQTEQKANDCLYSISIQVLDNHTQKPISGANIEFQNGLKGVMTNMTDQNGATEIALILDEEQGKTCTETLLSRGYSIEASRTGYAALGTGTVS